MEDKKALVKKVIDLNAAIVMSTLFPDKDTLKKTLIEMQKVNKHLGIDDPEECKRILSLH